MPILVILFKCHISEMAKVDNHQHSPPFWSFGGTGVVYDNAGNFVIAAEVGVFE
jgi:hypothetical protein